MKTIQESQTFTEAFYSKLLAADERYRKLFADTEFKVQNNMLAMGLFQVYTYNMTKMVEHNLVKIGQAHGGMGLDANDFAVWKQCMMETVAQFDDQYDATVEEQWENVIDASIAIIAKQTSKG